ncbi:MAG: hypothetical protein ABGX24_02185 [Aquificota bacterium]|jgi:hypothetical protein
MWDLTLVAKEVLNIVEFGIVIFLIGLTLWYLYGKHWDKEKEYAEFKIKMMETSCENGDCSPEEEKELKRLYAVRDQLLRKINRIKAVSDIGLSLIILPLLFLLLYALAYAVYSTFQQPLFGF